MRYFLTCAGFKIYIVHSFHSKWFLRSAQDVACDGQIDNSQLAYCTRSPTKYNEYKRDRLLSRLIRVSILLMVNLTVNIYHQQLLLGDSYLETMLLNLC